MHGVKSVNYVGSIFACSFFQNLVTKIGYIYWIFCFDTGEDGANTSTMEVIDGTHKKSPSNSSKGNKKSCPKQRVVKKHATTHMVDKFICIKGQVEKNKLPPSTNKRTRLAK